MGCSNSTEVTPTTGADRPGRSSHRNRSSSQRRVPAELGRPKEGFDGIVSPSHSDSAKRGSISSLTNDAALPTGNFLNPLSPKFARHHSADRIPTRTASNDRGNLAQSSYPPSRSWRSASSSSGDGTLKKKKKEVTGGKRRRSGTVSRSHSKSGTDISSTLDEDDEETDLEESELEEEEGEEGEGDDAATTTMTQSSGGADSGPHPPTSSSISSPGSLQARLNGESSQTPHSLGQTSTSSPSQGKGLEKEGEGSGGSSGSKGLPQNISVLMSPQIPKLVAAGGGSPGLGSSLAQLPFRNSTTSSSGSDPHFNGVGGGRGVGGGGNGLDNNHRHATDHSSHELQPLAITSASQRELMTPSETSRRDTIGSQQLMSDIIVHRDSIVSTAMSLESAGHRIRSNLNRRQGSIAPSPASSYLSPTVDRCETVSATSTVCRLQLQAEEARRQSRDGFVMEEPPHPLWWEPILKERTQRAMRVREQLQAMRDQFIVDRRSNSSNGAGSDNNLLSPHSQVSPPEPLDEATAQLVKNWTSGVVVPAHGRPVKSTSDPNPT